MKIKEMMAETRKETIICWVAQKSAPCLEVNYTWKKLFQVGSVAGRPTVIGADGHAIVVKRDI